MSILDRTRTNSSHPASRQSPSKLRRADRGAAGASAAVLAKAVCGFAAVASVLALS